MSAPDGQATSRTPSPARPERVIADLRELAELTGGTEGARRVCWTPTWQQAREWLRGKLATLPCTVEIDQAGNLWAEIEGASDEVVVLGSHIDSVPNGGWLDGALGIAGALEVLRRYADATPPVTLRLVDWADEEGARFGRSLFGSSAAAGTLDPEQVRPLRDRDGVSLPEALAACGVDIDSAHRAGERLKDIAAYLELHIEQGPVLERQGLALAAVLGTFGVERHAVRFVGRASHSGSTPMAMRKDALLSAARFALEARQIALRQGGGAVTTTGRITAEPGIVTAIAGESVVSIDQRALDAGALAAMYAEAREASERIAGEEGTTVGWEPLFQIEPRPFHPALIGFAEDACREVAGEHLSLPSGPLHDAAEMARLLPTVMLFVSSTNGISHNAVEDTPVAHLELGVRAFSLLADKTIAWVRGAES